ncbi:hypothetical protein [uncultured Agrobacterium sp.]|uniref:hypothetical protein n=1 Tax=uncultured Agrobacterium sp. TaxID=157277 RepID=UPI002582B1B9|nr:hypothetical protein [uncultured Agrobacterium sp.]
METIAKSLPEMDMGERLAMMDTVTQALADAAEHASNEGEVQLMQNFKAIAAMLEGGSDDLSSSDLKPVELMLRHALSLLHLYMERPERDMLLH